MKRKASGLESSPAKKQALKAPDYCDAEPRRDENGIIWPAPSEAIEAARELIKECASANQKTIIVPDKDADGLASGVIMHRTLTALGLSPSKIHTHLLPKGTTIPSPTSTTALTALSPSYIIILDQGSMFSPPIVPSPSVRTLILDHHLSDSFPENATVVSACHYPPVATSALLTYSICQPLHPTLGDSTAYICAIGTHGDLGALKWRPPFPDMSACFKTHSKKAISDAVALLNAPRRTAAFDVSSAWTALLESHGPRDILGNTRLQEARAEIGAEVERCTHAAPKFSRDGKIAVLRISSEAQVHPVIATRWAGHLKSKALEIVMVANEGYAEGMVNFSCRVARCARGREGGEVNIIESLKSAARLSADGLGERMGESFARGHKEASGGIVPREAFEELMVLLEVGFKPEKSEGGKGKASPKKAVQGNNLMNYFAKA